METTIKIRKINFLKQLLYHPVCYRIISGQLEELNKTPIKSLVHEVKKIINKYIDITNVEKMIEWKKSELIEATRRANETSDAKSIRYLLENPTSLNHELTKQLLGWDRRTSLRHRK